VAAPIFCDPETPLPGKPSLGAPFFAGAGIGVLALTIAAYAFVPALRRVRTGAASGRRIRGVDLLLLGALPIYLLYVGNGFFLGSGDSLATRRLPSLILQEGTIDLAHTPPFDQRDQRHYSVLWFDEKTLPSFPLGTAFLAVPYTAVALAATRGEVNDTLVVRWEKHLSALLATASACLLFLGVRERVGERPAAATTAVFALATPMVTYTSQALWTTTGESFWITTALYLLLTRDAPASRGALAGIALGLAYLCRPTSVLLILVFGAALLLWDRRAALPFVATSLASLLLVTLGLAVLYDHPLGGYGIMNGHSHLYGRDLSNGFLGVLLSPSRGLLVYFPYLLLVPLGLRLRQQDPESIRLTWISVAAVLPVYALAASYAKWWGGHAIGPRLLTETAPFLALLTLPLWARWSSWRPVFRATLSLSVLVASATQLRASYGRAALHWNPAVEVGVYPEALWSWRNSQLAAMWVPDWKLRLDLATTAAVDVPGYDPSRWHRVDLARVANARYDEDPFRPGTGTLPRFSRIDPEALNRDGAMFHFAARAHPNAVTTCGPREPPIIPTPGFPIVRIHGILTGWWPKAPKGNPVIGTMRLRYNDGRTEDLPLRLNLEVLPYENDPGKQPIPVDRIYFGRPMDPQALIATQLRPSRTNVGVASIQLLDGTGPPESGVVVLALSLERASLRSDRPLGPS
jgi:hypothetical protein